MAIEFTQISGAKSGGSSGSSGSLNIVELDFDLVNIASTQGTLTTEQLQIFKNNLYNYTIYKCLSSDLGNLYITTVSYSEQFLLLTTHVFILSIELESGNVGIIN